MKKLADKYNPKDFEDKLYSEWEEKGYFKPSMDKSHPSYSIVMPPPNVTGKLHMGHALDGTIQDILIRTKRMQGYNTLWLPGTDHASIATEVKVTEKLKSEGISKQDIGREKFLEKAWEWTRLYGGTIQEQQRKLGCSCDWNRARFTLDKGLSDAVLEEFVNLYNDGKIYKGKRMINWCPNCHTSLSDAEVEYVEQPSHLWHLRYKIVGEDNFVEVATTRPETMLGDTAVAVNPTDERYKNLVGKKCIVPIVNREIPIIADEFVDKEFGTGCVKVTPAHDPNDYQAGLKHNLEIIEVFDDHSVMNDLVPELKGMKSIDARPIIVDKLKELGNLVRIEDYTHNVGTCYRCHGIVEPRISEQWFVAMKELAKPAVEAVKNGEVKFVPKKYEKTYFNWLENIQDWCISRQLWWGHRIPAYYCDKCGHITVAKETPSKCESCGSTELHQDPDTLDTWFSSALWPFSTMGWPDTESEDFKTFFPTNTLVTGYDIILFWVIRMVFSSYYATKEQPFKDVVIHGLVRDSQGRKMSKSLGNGIDPLEIIDKYGADSLRFSLISGTTMGNDIKYMPEKLEQASNFANKIWNAAKFISNNISSREEIIAFCKDNTDARTGKFKQGSLKIEDEWIINELETLVNKVTKNINDYDLGIALDNIYTFIWDEFCDWYIEMAKSRLYSEDQAEKVQVSYVLNYVFKQAMQLLHPFMPFVTSEIYASLASCKEVPLMLTKWPDGSKKVEYDTNKDTIGKFKEIIVGIRNIRANMDIHPSKKAELIFVTTKYAKEIDESRNFLQKLGMGSEIKIQSDKTGISDNSISVITEGIELYMPFEDLVNIKEEIARLEKEKEKLEKEVQRSKGILSNKGFLEKAPESKINDEKDKLIKYTKMLEDIKARIASMQ